MSEDFIDLQTRIAFQEQTLEEINTIVTRQQKQIDVLVREFRSLKEQHDLMASQAPDAEPGDDKPPHY